MHAVALSSLGDVTALIDRPRPYTSRAKMKKHQVKGLKASGLDVYHET